MNKKQKRSATNTKLADTPRHGKPSLGDSRSHHAHHIRPRHLARRHNQE